MSDYIKRRDDVKPAEGERKYGDTEFADPTNKKYPVDSPDRVRAAWSYINQSDNAEKYSRDELDTIKNRIKRAAEKFGVEISTESEKE